MSSPYLDQLLTLLVSSAGSVIAKIGGAAGGGFNFVAPLTAVPNGATGNVDIGFAGGSAGGDVNPTANTFSIRDSAGQLRATTFATASTGVASTGVLRLPVGDGTIIAIKGASHASVPLIATANSGSQIVFGDGVEIQGYNFQSGLISQIGSVSFGIAVTPAFSQPQPSGTGTTVGATWTWTGTQGQNVSGGTNNNGGGFTWIAGVPGTGGSGGAQGAFSWQAGGITMGLGAAGLTVGGGSSVSYVDTPVASAPPNPAAGFIRYYTDGSGHPTVVNSAGALLDLAGTVAPNRGGTGLSSPGATGNVLTSTGSAWASSLPASLFFSLDCTVSGGAVTQASGKTLTNAVVVSVRLKTPSVAVGAPTAVISGNNVVVTSYTAGAIQAATDGSTYTVVLAGAV